MNSNMKKLLLIAVAVCSTLLASAQMKEGHLKYSIEVTSDNPDMAMIVGMMQGSKMDIYFADNETRVDMEMGSMMKTITIADTDKKETLTLMSGMMGNTAIKQPISNPEAEAEGEEDDIEVILEDETKDILGYTCKKAIIVDADGNESVFWYTDEIAINTEGQNVLSSKIPGQPLQMEVPTNGMNMTMTAIEFTEKLKKKLKTSLFDMTIPEGYTVKSTEELMEEIEQQQ
jgi:GLPGLI family protein